jgi:hypothetical protein
MFQPSDKHNACKHLSSDTRKSPENHTRAIACSSDACQVWRTPPARADKFDQSRRRNITVKSNKPSLNIHFGTLVRRSWLIVTTVTMMLLIANAAHAACGMRAELGSPTQPGLWSLASFGTPQGGGRPSIVGLWHVTYIYEGQLFYDAFDTWHSDGTEIEAANVPPIGGNICMGVWKVVGTSIHLNHVGWIFDNGGNPAGLFTLTEKNSLNGDGSSYKGTFDYKAYDPNGNLLQEVTGTLSATRIGVN